jgi:peptide/nickel transport system substrate-binding protein
MRGTMAILIALALAGCGASGGGKGGDRSDPVSHITPDQPVHYPRADYVETHPGHPGGTLHVSAARDNGTLDIHVLADTNTKWLGRTTFDNLVYLDDAGHVTPWLAKSWTISPDGLTYTFTLRDDVTFSDGEKLNAEAVQTNLARIRDPRTRTAMTTAYISPYVEGRVLSPYVFQARLSEPYAPFLNVLAQSWFGMIAPRQIREHPETIATKPIGTGPFVVESYVRNQRLTLVKRKDYHWAPDFLHHAGPAYLDRIEIVTVPEALSRYTGLAAGQQDFTTDAPAQNAAAIRSDDNLVFRSRINLGNPGRGISFNVEKPPFDDVRVRQALARAIDREGVTRSAGFGEYPPTAGFLSALTPYYDPRASKALDYDPAAANRLLDEAGWTGRDPDGIRTRDGQRLSARVLTTDASPLSFIIVTMQSDFRKVGFDLQLEPVPASQFAQHRTADDYQATGAGYWHTNTPDGLYIVYHGKQINRGQYTGQNITRIDDPEMNDLLSRARRGDPKLLADLYSRAQARLVLLVPAIPVLENTTLVAYRKPVRGLVFDTSHNTPLFTTIWLQGADR